MRTPRCYAEALLLRLSRATLVAKIGNSQAVKLHRSLDLCDRLGTPFLQQLCSFFFEGNDLFFDGKVA